MEDGLGLGAEVQDAAPTDVHGLVRGEFGCPDGAGTVDVDRAEGDEFAGAGGRVELELDECPYGGRDEGADGVDVCLGDGPDRIGIERGRATFVECLDQLQGLIGGDRDTFAGACPLEEVLDHGRVVVDGDAREP